ncbi:unnamed protein product [Acanthoscelides obtectus]|uniref:Osiris 19 n=1 Tax=Acanthoscelides obtectus TaxID=200917 RepID=A0A9P0P2E2_ACAOB|nr:unnamed protein product [Acanthoscelides obtectus]CAK1648105.1 hypothetical protein AOBTE_LOCUS15543 [Acanthoscelides obtectus]
MSQWVLCLVCAVAVTAVAVALPAAKEENAVLPRSFNEMVEDIQNEVINYIKSNDMSVDMPLIGSIATVDARNLDNDEVSLKLNFGSGDVGEARRRTKHKIKKALMPIAIFVIIKAMVLIPLALGLLGFKAFNAMQLAFISFVSAGALAIWKFCSKVNSDQQPQIVHAAWDPHHLHTDRTDLTQQLAYSAYAPYR